MRYSAAIDTFEKNLIAALLGVMTLVTFANVIARSLFSANILWSLELTVFLFAWLVLIGASYGVKHGLHIGVDVIVNTLSGKARRRLALAAATVCLLYAFLMLKGAWDYWANFANLPATEGRWFPLGFEEKFRGRGWYEVDDIPHPWFLAWMADVFNEGEAYEKLPRLIPYVALPITMATMFYRLCAAFVAIWWGQIDRLISHHETETNPALLND